MIDVLFSFLKAFLVGGAICTIAQLLINYTKLTSGRILVFFMLAGLFLQSIGVYQYIVDFAGAGATVPLTGFGHLLAEGVRRYVSEDGFIGIFTGGMTAAAGGITAAILSGLIAAIVFKQRDKN